MKHQHLILNQQPLAFGSFSNWVRLLWQNDGVDLKYVPRALFVTLSSLLSSPLRLYEQAKVGHLMADQSIEKPPVFIIGHWRSGTTYLHNLMSLDSQFSYLSTLQAWAPELCLTNRWLIAPILEWMTPKTRPMDNVSLALDYPQEEEFCLANLSPFSFYHGWYFPRAMRDYFEQFVLFNEISPAVFSQWKQAYLKTLKLASLNTQGRRLLIKNPANTGRIKALLELFPDAKFIHIYRNPYTVYFSTRRLYQKLLPVIALQDFSEQAIEENIFAFYQKIMDKFFLEKHLIPPDNLIEMRYEDLEVQPLHQLQRIYQQFGLPDFEPMTEKFESYIASQGSYQRNRYTLEDSEIIRKIYQHWQFTIDQWQYPEPVLSPCESIT
ncbi:MAG: sulfotransferase family protein [Almyronema sp.]